MSDFTFSPPPTPVPAAAYVVIERGPMPDKRYDITAVTSTIGRSPQNEIVINDPEMSRRHAQIVQQGEIFAVSDLGSTNGTFVNGQRLGSEPFALQPGQAVNMGSGVRLVYEIAGTLESDVSTMVDETPLWAAASAAPPLAETESPAAQPDPPPAYAAPPTYPSYQYSASPPPYQSAPEPTYPPLVPPGEPPNKNRRNMTIVAVVLLLLCCCCTFIGFMYQWGGDWLLQYLGIF